MRASCFKADGVVLWTGVAQRGFVWALYRPHSLFLFFNVALRVKGSTRRLLGSTTMQQNRT